MARTFLGAALLALMLAGTARAQTMPQIVAADARFMAAFNAGDAAGVAALYTPKATLLPPGVGAITGREGIQAFWAGAITSGLTNARLHTLRVDALGPGVGREIGRFTLDGPGQGGATARISGKYVVIWRRIGKAWRLETDIWNTDGP